ncbi:MAG: C39 family peptidase [Lachnospiraceae bacterium]|nr:C39 family peptidase [Lachnospiraceae bacterium]
MTVINDILFRMGRTRKKKKKRKFLIYLTVNSILMVLLIVFSFHFEDIRAYVNEFAEKRKEERLAGENSSYEFELAVPLAEITPLPKPSPTSAPTEIPIPVLTPPLITDSSTVFLSVNAVLQYPELPNGCEVTALTEVLNYLGFNIDKVTLARKYLDKAAPGSVTPYEAFWGNPESSDSYGCYAPVIVSCANRYLDEQDSLLIAKDVSGMRFEELLNFINEGHPVIIWITNDLEESRLSDRVWNINGVAFAWKVPNHCVVLHGYNKSKNIVYIADPLRGSTTYKLDLVAKRYKEMYLQAVVIQ